MLFGLCKRFCLATIGAMCFFNASASVGAFFYLQKNKRGDCVLYEAIWGAYENIVMEACYEKILKGYLIGFISAAILVSSVTYAINTTTLYDVVVNGIKTGYSSSFMNSLSIYLGDAGFYQ